jgi:glutamyl-tRNA synthetase
MSEFKKINEIRVRFPPSPTGFLHVGNARTAIFNWLFAKHNNGKFILRIEDTDQERSKKEYEDDIVEGLKWLGLEWDEFYKQSDRLPIYSKYLQKLLAEKKAFWCYHSEEELEKERQEQILNKVIPRHVCSYKSEIKNPKSETEIKKGVIRLAVDENSTRKIRFEDLIRGNIEFEERLLGDFSIARDLDAPLYHFAVVVDDYEMGISHVIRGEDHIANTPKQILIQEALGFERPQYAHLPLLLGPDKSKLSKRHGAVSLNEYKKLGYLPEAMFNFLALLGFTPPENREIFSRDELIAMFDLAKVHKSGAIFNTQKLDWMNGEYIKRLKDDELAEKIIQSQSSRLPEFWASEFLKEDLIKIMPLARERMKKLSDIFEFNYFFKEPEYDRGLLLWKDKSFEEIKNSLSEVAKIIEEKGTENKETLRQELDLLGAKLGDRGLVYWPFRVALTGRKASPDPIDIAVILGKQKTLERVKRAIENLG